MDNRQAIGSWLSGPRAALENAGAEFGYRGEQLGLPENGPGSIARPGRRLGALAVDWGLCMLIAYGLLTDGYDGQSTGNWALLVFLVLSVLTVGTLGFTPASGCSDCGSSPRTPARSSRCAHWCARCCCASPFPPSSGTATAADCTTGWPARSRCASDTRPRVDTTTGAPE
ncbi:hypothetical protein SHKM778_72700 [Streptomyces sp. KM77-8]|uniref:RDD family protein n=1 Tax=Streptomyces haneummycinicus TaxID=3074435 RepID=A0AAT9HUD3_9ACTN